jgi:hypothetical protein
MNMTIKDIQITFYKTTAIPALALKYGQQQRKTKERNNNQISFHGWKSPEIAWGEI